jgi:hypothetical protein
MPYERAPPAEKGALKPKQTSVRAFPAVSLVYLSIECPFNKFYGINCRPKVNAKLLDSFFHRRRQISPPINNLAHRFFDGSQHLLYCNFPVGSCHSAVASSSVYKLQQTAALLVTYPRGGSEPQSPNGIVSSVSFVSTTNTARSLAGFVPLALALTPWRSPGSSEKLCPIS